MNCNDELYHYGVLGMKWGVHRARKKGSAYSYKSHKTKKYERQAEKYAGTKRGNLAARKAKSSARWDTNYQRRAEGASIARTLLLTGLNETAYQSLRASGVSKGKAIVGAILGTGIVNPIARNKYINDHSGPGGAKSGSQDSSVGDTAKAQKKWNRRTTVR